MATISDMQQKILNDLNTISSTPTSQLGETLALYIKSYLNLETAQAPIPKIYNCVDTSSSTTAYTATVIGYTAYDTGHIFYFKANTANAGACTINISTVGAKSIKKNVSSDLSENDIKANQIVILYYDGTNMQLLSR